jgi:hypothetical protein
MTDVIMTGCDNQLTNSDELLQHINLLWILITIHSSPGTLPPSQQVVVLA